MRQQAAAAPSSAPSRRPTCPSGGCCPSRVAPRPVRFPCLTEACHLIAPTTTSRLVRTVSVLSGRGRPESYSVTLRDERRRHATHSRLCLQQVVGGLATGIPPRFLEHRPRPGPGISRAVSAGRGVKVTSPASRSRHALVHAALTTLRRPPAPTTRSSPALAAAATSTMVT